MNALRETVVPFRFDREAHRYTTLTSGREIPHITGILVRSGTVNPEWFTEESCERGRIVHEWTATWDMEAIPTPHFEAHVSLYRGWLLAHVAATKTLRPSWDWIEVPAVHQGYGFGGRPDRVGRLMGAVAIAEIKTGPSDRAHCVQTGLQALLVAPAFGLPPEAIPRYGWYLTEAGKWKIEQHKDRRDLDEAKRLAKRYGVGSLR